MVLASIYTLDSLLPLLHVCLHVCLSVSLCVSPQSSWYILSNLFIFLLTHSTNLLPLTLSPQQRLLADAITYRSSLRDLTTIVKCGADVNGMVKRGLRPLHYAVHAGNIEGVNFLLEHGADVNAPDDIGYRPVHLCARKGQSQWQLLIALVFTNIVF